MTVKELIKELKSYPQDCEVRIIRDFEDIDSESNNTNTEELTYVGEQTWFDDQFGSDNDVTEVIIG